MLDLPKTIRVKGRDGRMHDGVRMWRYMALQEGTLGVDPEFQKTNDGRMPPVIHVDTDAPLYSDRDGKLITDKLWGLYYKPDFHFNGVQGGAMPAAVDVMLRGSRQTLNALDSDEIVAYIDLGGLGAGPHPQAGTALHAPMHDRVGGSLETLLTRADLALRVEMAVARGQLTVGGRAHFRVRQRKFL